MRQLCVVVVVVGALFVWRASGQTITTQQDYMAADKAELQALIKESNGDIYSLPHDKKIRVAEIELKYFIRENFIDPDSVQAIITNDPHHGDIKVWQGLFGGGNKIYSGMVVCARINGKNRLGGYVGETDYLIIFERDGSYRWYQSPYYSPITQENETNSTVTQNCSS